MDWLPWLLPWEWSPAVMLGCALAVGLFARGVQQERSRGTNTALWRSALFYLGVALVYVPLQTRFDYLAQHMFWIHRLQHLLLHHLGPFFIAWAAPWSLIAAGLPVRWRPAVHRVLLSTAVRRPYRVLQSPVVAPVLFVGLIYFWLLPGIHFRAMLSAVEYKWMNWSMVLDGLLFWWLLLDPRSRERGAQMGFGARIPVALAVVLPQILIGAYLSLHKGTLYDVYAVCGRLWPLDPVTDQQTGGLITWIPASMMSLAPVLILWARWLHNDALVHCQRTHGTAHAAALPGGLG
jgi:putative membrane protein